MHDGRQTSEINGKSQRVSSHDLKTSHTSTEVEPEKPPASVYVPPKQKRFICVAVADGEPPPFTMQIPLREAGLTLPTVGSHIFHSPCTTGALLNADWRRSPGGRRRRRSVAHQRYPVTRRHERRWAGAGCHQRSSGDPKLTKDSIQVLLNCRACWLNWLVGEQRGMLQTVAGVRG